MAELDAWAVAWDRLGFDNGFRLLSAAVEPMLLPDDWCESVLPCVVELERVRRPLGSGSTARLAPGGTRGRGGASTSMCCSIRAARVLCGPEVRAEAVGRSLSAVEVDGWARV